MSTVSKAANNYKNLYKIPPKNIVLPGLLLGNMAYKLGNEKNPIKRDNVLWNQLTSWLGGALLYNANNKVLPYFTLPFVAGSIALFRIAEKTTAEEKADTAINHASWWGSAILTQELAKKFNIKGTFQGMCAFAVGASIVGPIISNFIKQKILPLLGQKDKTQIGNSFDNLKVNYNTGTKTNTDFSPFTEIPAYELNGRDERVNVDLDKTAYDPFNPFNINTSAIKKIP